MTPLFVRLRRLWLPETVLFLGLWLLLLIGGRSRLFRDPGTFWHTRLGQEMLASGHFVHGDPFSFTAEQLPAGKTWIPHQWLGECLMASIYAWHGWDSLLLATVTLLAGLYAWIGRRLMRAGLHWSLAVSFVALALGAGSNHFHVRPHLATFVGFALTFALLQDFEAGRIRVRQLFWLVPVYVLWTNLHGGMLGGLVTMGLAIAGWIGARMLGWKNPIGCTRQCFVLMGLLLACAITAWINPYGARIPETWLEILRAPHLTEIIQEHARLDVSQPEGMMVVVLAAIYLGLLASVRPWRPRVTWLLPLVWLPLACSRVRHAPLFGLAAVLAIADVFPETRWAQAIERAGGDLFVRPARTAKSRRLAALIVPIVFVSAGVLLQANVIPSPLGKMPWAVLDTKLWPVSLIDDLRGEKGQRVFNELNLGGFLIFYAPQLRIFIDDRCELYGDDFLRRYDEAARREPETLDRWREAYGFRLAVTQTGSTFDAYLRRPDSGWRLVAECESATLHHWHNAP